MKLSFHGAAQTVTGSKHLISLENGRNLLLDCGMFQGFGSRNYDLNHHFGFDPKTIDYMVLSHAHIDHSGLIPRLVALGFKGNIYCTHATFDLCKIMLMDSAHIQEDDAVYVNKKRKKNNEALISPLYTKEDVEKALKQFVPKPFNKEFELDDFIKVLFTDNGHILGSAAISLRITEGSLSKKVFFSGDVGRYKTALLKDPQSFPQADIIIMESTYGNRLHDDVSKASQQILNAAIEICGEKKGKLIIPAFSLGRTQELIYALNRLDLFGLLPDVKIYIDSPLAISATEITRQHMECLNQNVHNFTEGRPNPFGFDDLKYVRERESSKALNFLKEPCIIISASGMADAGRVKHHIKHAITHKENAILLVGYASPNSLAGRLKSGVEKVRIYGDYFPVKASVKVLDSLSAHGDYEEMIRYLSCQDPKKVEKVFLVHGEPEAQLFFKDKLAEVGFRNIYRPEQDDFFYV